MSSTTLTKLKPDKNDKKQYLGLGHVLIVLVTILFSFAVLLPFGFYRGNQQPFIPFGYLGALYKTKHTVPPSNATHIHIDASIKGYIKIELDPLSEDKLEMTEDEKTISVNLSNSTIEREYHLSRVKRASIKEVTYTDEQQYYINGYEAYLKCIEEKTDKYYEALAMKPLVELGEEDSPVTLKCNMCYRPDQEFTKYSFVWRRFLKYSSNQTWEDIPENSDNFDIDLVTGDIEMNNLEEEDSGRYICYLRNNEFQSVHYLDILATERTRQVFDDSLGQPEQLKPKESNGTNAENIKLAKAKPSQQLEALNLLLYTTWGEWTRCTRCGSRGERARHGQCTIKILDEKNNTEYEILKRFPEGLPCRSSLVPRSLTELKEVKERYSENEVGYCLEECPKEPKKVLDENGKPVKVFKNPLKKLKVFKKIKRFMAAMPRLVVRRVYYVVVGKKTALKCPNAHGGQAVRWSNKSQVYDRVELAQDPEHRVNIDTASRLIIHDLRETDTSLYTCHVYGKLHGSIKLKVVQPYKEEGVSDWITTAGLVGTVLLIAYLGVMLFLQEKKFGKVMQ